MSFGAILDGFHKKKRGTDRPLLRMEVVRITLISRNRNQSTLIYARTITLLLLIIEVSHVSIRKTSITLRVPLCWRHRSRLRTAAKIQRNRKSKRISRIFLTKAGIFSLIIKKRPIFVQLNKQKIGLLRALQ